MADRKELPKETMEKSNANITPDALPTNDIHSHKFETNRDYFIISIYVLAVIAIGTVIINLITNFSVTTSYSGST